MKDYFSRFFRYLAVFTLSLTLSGESAFSNEADHSPIRLSNHMPTEVLSKSTFVGNLNENDHVHVAFVLPWRNQKQLEKLLQRLYDPNDHECYGKYLTTEEFIERFAPTQKDYDRVIAYAQNSGLTVTGTHSNRLFVNVSGPAAAVEQAFSLRLEHYETPHGRKFYAPSNNPEIPSSIASIIAGVVGLDNHAKWRPFHKLKENDTIKTAGPTEKTSLLTAQATTYPSGPGGGYSPADIIRAYNLTDIPTNGAGQNVALFQLAGYLLSDINYYTDYFGLPRAKLTNILVDGGPSGIDPEVTLDIQLVLALAPASHIYVYEGPNSYQGVLDTYNRIATDNIAKQVSSSWGLSEDFLNAQFLQAENAIFQQMAAHGQSIYAAAGDSGAFDNYNHNSSTALAVDDPGAQPYVVSVGGTRLFVNSGNGNYSSESVWNNGLGNGAGGGGVSHFWPIPSWQTSIPTIASKKKRNTPDVALNSDPQSGYSIYHAGQWRIYGGTSCAAPLWAGFTARVNEYLVAHSKPVLGFLSPTLYAIGQAETYQNCFHDITSGDNLHYHAAGNYDNATGWGSFNGANLFAALTNLSPTPTPAPPLVTPVLDVAITQGTSFSRGKTGSYNLLVSNRGTGPTSGPVTLTIKIPTGMKCLSCTGSGWKFDGNLLTCKRNTPLAAGASYPSLTLKVNVARNAPGALTPTVTVSGGGSVSNMTSSRTVIR